MARASGGGEDEYQTLQLRFQMLESERKNLFEHIQVFINTLNCLEYLNGLDRLLKHIISIDPLRIVFNIEVQDNGLRLG
jgi:hypothetical protein